MPVSDKLMSTERLTSCRVGGKSIILAITGGRRWNQKRNITDDFISPNIPTWCALSGEQFKSRNISTNAGNPVTNDVWLLGVQSAWMNND